MNINLRRLASHTLLAVLPLLLILPATVEAASVERTSPAKSKKHNKNKKRLVTCDSYSRNKLLSKAKKYQDIITKSSQDYKVSPHLITAVIAVESCFRPRVRSSAGAAGLMQLMPATARRFGTTKRYNTKHNIKAGTKYLKFLLKRYQGNVLLAAAAYNAGEGAVDKYNGVPPYKETQNYVRKVIKVYRKLSKRPEHLRTAKTKTPNVKKSRVARTSRVAKVRQTRKSRAWYIKRYEQMQARKKLDLTTYELKHANRLIRNEEVESTLSFKQFL